MLIVTFHAARQLPAWLIFDVRQRMKFDARIDSSPERKEAFEAWLVLETVSALSRAAGNPEALKAAVFLFLNRAYEAGVPANEITDLLGIGPASALSRASLSKKDEESVLAAFDELDGIVEAVHSKPSSKKNA